ncbi:MAG: Na+:solute symporter [Myxococcales bacterium]|nr:Na+:solute symporter [Myxococcales bacterium]
MRLSALDFAVLAAYFLLSAALGLRFARRAGKSAGEFFTAGRSLPWWLAGTSMVATTFAADTPLAVTGLVAEHGIAGNWVWWSMVMGSVLTVFLYARLWRRAEVTTDVEFAELRYSGRPAAFLRAFRALYLALPINLIVMGWVNLAMVKVLELTLGVRPFAAMLLLLALTVVYSSASGLWGVVVTDALQFTVAMLGCIALAYFAVDAVGGLEQLSARLPKRYGSAEAALSFFPTSGAWMPLTALLAYLAVQWWATWYPGAEPGGGGYVAQRILSSRSERDGVLATLWFTLAHYAVRPWPWILTALASVLLYPELQDKSSGYIRAAVELLPSGLKGLFLAAFAAAYMSTLSTQLNWGASYLVNDVYARFVRQKAEPKELVRISRLLTAALFLLSAGSTWLLERLGSIEGAWRLLIALGAGTGAVYLLRWYWWRINAWSEVSAMAASLVSFVALTLLGLNPADPLESAQLMLATAGLTTVAWVVVTLLTRPADEETLLSFYRRVRPPGPGWRKVAERAGLPPEGGLSRAILGWAAGVVCVYGALFGVGKLLLGPRLEGAGYLAASAVAFAVVAKSLATRR